MIALYEKKETPGSLIYRTDKNLTEEQKVKFKKDFKKLYEGVNYAPGTLSLMSMGSEIKKAEVTSWPPKEHIIKRVTAEVAT